MKKLECPNCHAELKLSREKTGIFFTCPSCGGRSAGMMLLRKIGMPWEYYDLLYKAGKKTPDPFAKLCPHCGKKMATCTLPIGKGPTLDICRRCQQVWFDPSEFSDIPFKPEPPKEEKPELPPECKEAIALAAIKSVEEKAALEDIKNHRYGHNQWTPLGGMEGPPEAWQWIPAFFGLPVEMDAASRKSLPWVTWSFSLIMIVIFAAQMIFIPEKELAGEFGFISGDWGRLYGFTIISSFFLHGGVFHLVSNLYFLVIFGDDVEDRLGKVKFVLLLLFSHLAGLLLFSVLDRHVNIPTIGASGGIAGIVAYYAICFPYARLGFFFWHFDNYLHWVKIPAAGAFVLFAILQIIGSYCQFNGYAGVNYLAHMGGLAVGFAAALASHFSRYAEIKNL